MQTATYTVNSGGGIALWRGIPAQITISGVEDTSGDWLFLVDNDLADGVILSGTVAADGETLVVTLENMNTVELAAVINGKPNLQCRATLTDGTSSVYFVPLTVINRAMDGQPPPTPVSEYYTKAQIDAMIAAIPTGTDDYTELNNKPAINGHTLTGDQTAADLGLATPEQIPPAQVQANWNETDTASKAYIQNKPVIPSVPVTSVNSKTGDVVLNASDVGAVSKDGLPIVALESGTIPAPGAVYTFTPSAATEFAFPTPVAGKDNYFRLAITMPTPAVAVTFPAGLVWKFATPALAAGTTSELAFAWNGASWEGWTTPDLSQYALASNVLPLDGGTLTGALTISRDTIPRPQIELVFNGNVGFLVNNNRLQLGGNIGTAENYGSVGIGFQNSSTGGFGCMTLGRGLTNAVNSSLVVGEYNATDTDYVLVCANGTSTYERANAFVIKKSGDAVLAGDLTFTPSGASEATTLSALIARLEALEQAMQ